MESKDKDRKQVGVTDKKVGESKFLSRTDVSEGGENRSWKEY